MTAAVSRAGHTEGAGPTANVGNRGPWSKESFDKLRAIMYIKHVRKGSYLFWEGDAASRLYFVLKGQVKIIKTLDTGRAITLYLHQEGDLIGQLDPFPDSVHAFAAKVAEDGTFGVIQRDDLEALLWQHGDLAIEFARWAGMTQRLTQAKLRDFMLFGKTGALCSLLIRLGNSYGVDEEEGTIIGCKLSHAEMADMIGATRESVNRTLGSLKKKGVIDFRDGCIVICDLAYLRDVCQCENCPKEICRI